MKKLIHSHSLNDPKNNLTASSDESIADWIALYWSISKRFRKDLDKPLASSKKQTTTPQGPNINLTKEGQPADISWEELDGVTY